MAKVKYSALVSDMRNKLNGSVLSKNKYGSYIRNKVTPTNPQSAAQVAQRAKLATFASKWRTLTEEQRQAWNDAVSGWSRTDIFGDSQNPTGSILHNRLNMTIATAGGTAIVLPPMPLGAPSPTALSVVTDTVASTMEVTFAQTPVPAGMALVVEASPGMSAGISVANSQLRIIAVLPATTATGADVYAEYVAKYGSPTIGMKIFYRISMIRIATGEKSQFQKFAEVIA